MTITEDTQAQLLALHKRYEELERQARLVEAAPADTLLIIRADGVKHSKHFLKNSLDQPDYDRALHEALLQTYYIWRHWTSKENTPYLLGALRLSDEVSLIVNRGDNYYNRRLYKITSTLASTLSGSMSLAFAPIARAKLKQDAPVMTFDGRPLLVATAQDLFAYIHSRRLLHARNAMARVLRLKSDLTGPQLYEEQPKLAEDIFRLSQAIDERNLWPAFQRAAAGASLYVAEANGRFDEYPLPADPTDDAVVRESWRTP
jgi:tRNA(His) 5'-end guanylyltransferase